MSNEKHEKHGLEPRIHIAKRDDMIWYKSWGVRLVAIVLALILCAFVIVLLTGYDPIKVYASMIFGNFGTPRKVWNMLQKLSILLLIKI